MNSNDIRAKSLAELDELLISLHREQFNLRMQKATGQLAKPDVISRNRRTIARIHTILSEKAKS